MEFPDLPKEKHKIKPKAASHSQSVSKRQVQAIPTPGPNRSTDTSSESASPAKSQPAQSFSRPARIILPWAAKVNNPGRRLHALEEAGKKVPPARLPWKYRLRPTRERTHRAFWDVGTTLSLIINVVLIGLLIIMAGQIRTLKTTLNSTVNNLVGGLYGNFVKMDQASISTTIQVNTQIPLNFTLPVSQGTEVVLTRDVNIPGAHVVINTGGLNINAQANVTLPAGTTLPISLNLDIPVQSTIPISLQVPVKIPLNQTELHEPFTGLQTSLRPLYCMLNKNAQYPQGIFICAEHDVPTPGAP